MNRTGLFIALAVAVIVGVLFSIHAQFDLDLSGLFFDPDTHRFRIYAQPWEQHARDASRWLIILLVAPGFLALGGKLIWPRRRMLIGGRSALFLVLTLALGPGLLATHSSKTIGAAPVPSTSSNLAALTLYTVVESWRPVSQ